MLDFSDLAIMLLTFLRVTAFTHISLHLTARERCTARTERTLRFHSPFGGYLDCFRFGAVTNKATVNVTYTHRRAFQVLSGRFLGTECVGGTLTIWAWFVRKLLFKYDLTLRYTCINFSKVAVPSCVLTFLYILTKT